MKPCFKVGIVAILCASSVDVVFARTGSDESEKTKKRVAIIGGGIGGSFAANYLAEYDRDCALAAVDLYEPSPLSDPARGEQKGRGVTPTSGEPEGPNDDWQGSRVSSITLEDDTVVELGASIIFDGNRLTVEMMKDDPDLVAGKPMSPGKKKEKVVNGRESNVGFGIYDGAGEWSVTLSNRRSWVRALKLLWRYNFDLLKMDRTASRALESFDLIYELLESSHPASFLQSPDEMWDSVGLLIPTTMSFDAFLDAVGVCREIQWWRKFIPYQGSIRNELLAAVNINNYNQDNQKMNGLAGLVSFVPTKGDLFSVQGGNYQLISSAIKQAKRKHTKACGEGSESRLRHIRRRVTTVVSDFEEGMELFSGEDSFGKYDVVVLAVPLQHSNVDFLVRSQFDEAVLAPMPLGGMIDSDVVDADGHRHSAPLLPPSTSQKYTQVVTTVIRNVDINETYFNVSNDEDLPRSIYYSERGRELENITTITQLTPDGVYKMFSVERVPPERLRNIFGPSHEVIYEKVWGGPHGGATPDFGGGGEASASSKYLLFDGGLGMKGHGDGPALYYINSIEAAVSAVEIVAIGAKSVSKLVAQRLGLIVPSTSGKGEEL